MTVFVSDADHEGLHCRDENKLRMSKEQSRLLFVHGQLHVPTGPLFMVFLGASGAGLFFVEDAASKPQLSQREDTTQVHFYKFQKSP